MGFDGLKDLLAKLVLIKEMAEGLDHGLIRDPITDMLDAIKAALARHLDQGSLHGRVAKRIPLPKQGDAQHADELIGRPTAFLPCLGVVEFDQLDQHLPWHHHFHLHEKHLPLGQPLARDELVIREVELLATHQPNPDLRLKGHYPEKGAGFPELPQTNEPDRMRQ